MSDYPDFEGNKSKLFTVADWSAVEATDKNLEGSNTFLAAGRSIVIDYVIPSGSTFYICQWGFEIEKDTFVIGELTSYDGATSTYLGVNGGKPGNALSLSKPVAITGGDHCRLLLSVGAAGTGRGFIGGYLI